jgi:glycine cleavage system H protein
MSQTRYTRDHEWVRLDTAGIATVGITDHAQAALGDIVFVDLPDPGREVTAGEDCAVVESVKAASDIFAPLAGRIIETNAALADDPALVNREPAGEGWFFRMQPADPAAFESLLDEAAYAGLIAEGA